MIIEYRKFSLKIKILFIRLFEYRNIEKYKLFNYRKLIYYVHWTQKKINKHFKSYSFDYLNTEIRLFKYRNI